MPGASSLLTPRGWAWFLGLGAALVIGVPLLNALPPAGSALQLPDYLVPLLGKYLCYALLALSLDLIWGYAGILSLGHGAFFALGGYAMGMYLMRQIGTRGVYANAELPDFMVFLNWKALPWYWWGFDHFAFAALIYALWLAFFRNDMGFGGNNGLTDFKDVFGFDLHAASTRRGLYIASVIALGLGYLACRFIVASKLGRLLRALRDAESRVRFLGYSVDHAKLFVFTVSAVLARIAGP